MQSIRSSLFGKFSRFKKLITIAVSFSLILLAAIYFYRHQSPPRTIEDIAIEIVQLQLADPDSAKFKNVAYKKGIGVCGEVNAKNRMGGYVGYKTFVVEDNGLLLLEGPELQKYQMEILKRCYSL